MIVLLLCILAFLCQALAMERHQEDLFDRQLAKGLTAVLRVAGLGLLAGSLALALHQPLWAQGLVAWFGSLSLGAGLVFGVLILIGRGAVSR